MNSERTEPGGSSMGGRGGDSYVMAHVESPAVLSVMGVLAGCGRSRGMWGILGRSGGGDKDDRRVPLGRGSVKRGGTNLI